MPAREGISPVSTDYVHAPAANTAAVVTISADANEPHMVSQVEWSYSGTPTSGNLKIENGSGTTVKSLDITEGGPGYIHFDPPLVFSKNTAAIFTLAAAGAGVSGKVNVSPFVRTR